MQPTGRGVHACEYVLWSKAIFFLSYHKPGSVTLFLVHTSVLGLVLSSTSTGSEKQQQSIETNLFISYQHRYLLLVYEGYGFIFK